MPFSHLPPSADPQTQSGALLSRRGALLLQALRFLSSLFAVKVQLLLKHDRKPASLLVTLDSVINAHLGFMCERKVRSKVRVT